MTWKPTRQLQINFSESWRHLLREWGIIGDYDEDTLYGSDAWAFSAVIHLQSLISAHPPTTVFSYRFRMWLIWNAIRFDRAKLSAVEQIAVGYVNDALTPNEARARLKSEGLWPETLEEANLVEIVPNEIMMIEDNDTFQIALDSYRKNRL